MIIGIVASQQPAVVPIAPVNPTLVVVDTTRCGYVRVRATNGDPENVTMYINGINLGTLAPGASATQDISAPEGRNYTIWARSLKGGLYSDYVYVSGTKPSFCFS